jgi:GAF domain-containing protein
MITREAVYRDVLEAIDRYAATEPDPERALERTVELLHDSFEHYTWVGVYLVDDDDLVLGPWRGSEETEHTRIPIGEGVCGAAAASGVTEVVDDVAADARYLACFPSTRSEIVVPIFESAGTPSQPRRIIGEIDIDSDRPAAFDDDDVVFLEHVARTIAARCPA